MGNGRTFGATSLRWNSMVLPNGSYSGTDGRPRGGGGALVFGLGAPAGGVVCCCANAAPLATSAPKLRRLRFFMAISPSIAEHQPKMTFESSLPAGAPW